MNAGELKEWLTDVPDNAEIIGKVDSAESETYTAQPYYNENDNKIEIVFGV
jgi:hypothetical protein